MARWRTVTGLVVAAWLGSLLAMGGVGKAENPAPAVPAAANADVRLQAGGAIVSITPNSGSVAGGTAVTVSATGFADFATLPSVTISGIVLPSASVSAIAGQPTMFTVTTPAHVTVGAVSVHISQGATQAVDETGFIYRPLLQPVFGRTTGLGNEVSLSALASRSEGKQVTRSATAPYTVEGIDGRTGLTYTETTNFHYDVTLTCDDSPDGKCVGYESEGYQVVPTTVTHMTVSNSSAHTPTFNVERDSYITLHSALNCSYSNLRSNGRTAYCSIFGPEVWSEPFYATSDSALAFDWRAVRVSDDYEIYAFLVTVDDPSVDATIPNLTTSLAAATTSVIGYHTLLVHELGKQTPWNTGAGNVPRDGFYRFRFVNGSYDATGGKALGSVMYLDPTVIVGLPNAITFNPDPVTQSAAEVALAAASTGPVTAVSTTTNTCTVNVVNNVATITKVGLGTCTIVASAGAFGRYAPAQSATRSFQITALPPAAPTITGITGGPGALSVAFTAGSNNGSPITQYQYSVNNGGSWTPLTVGATTSPLTIPGLQGAVTYNVRIRAVNAAGAGAQSNQISGTTQAVANLLPEVIPTSTTTPPTTTVAPTTTVGPSVTTTVPPSATTTVPSSSVPAPVPATGGSLPALPPGVSQVIENGVATPVEVFVQDQTELVLRGDGFQMALAGECSFGCTIRTDPEGRQVLELEANGLARVEGEGFLPGTPVYVWLFSEPKFLGELTVNADGSFAGAVSIAGIEVGGHTLQVNGTSFDGRSRTANLGVLVSPEGVPSPLPTVLPATGVDVGVFVWVMLLTALGGALVWMSRRRTVPTQR